MLFINLVIAQRTSAWQPIFGPNCRIGLPQLYSFATAFWNEVENGKSDIRWL